MKNCGPVYQVDYGSDQPCEQTNSDCTIFQEPIPYLSLPENSTLTEVVTNLILALQDARNRIEQLENQ